MKNTFVPISVSSYGYTLAELIQDLDRRGINKDQYNKLQFELDYSDCYYESDEGKTVLVLKK